MDELGLERRERDGHGRGHGRLEGRQGHGHRDAGGKSASVEVTVEAQDPYAELDALAKAHASDLEDGTYTVSTVLKDGHGPGRGGRFREGRRERAAVVVERDEGAAVDGFARLEGLRDAEEREFRQGAGCEGRQGRERFERAAVRAELLPFAEVGGGQERIGVQTGVRALPVHGAGREGRQGRERFERADLHRQRVPFPAVDVQNGRPAVEVGDGLVPSLVHAVARACAVARVRQSGHDRRRGDDAGVRRLVEGHGAFRGLH